VVRIGACQTPEILGDINRAVACVETFAAQCHGEDLDLLLFPECFLQGYLVEQQHLRDHALDLASAAFQDVLTRLSRLQPTLVFGVIEQAGAAYFNTAVVVRQGVLQCTYRKTHLTTGERLFQPGSGCTTFDINGVRCGINICYDTNFADAAGALASGGARVLLVPSQNMMKREAAESWRTRHNQIRAERIRETGMWLVSADVTGARDDTRIGCGPTSIMNPRAELVAQVPLMTVGMVTADIQPH
jgi:predicted amidohydrolase